MKRIAGVTLGLVFVGGIAATMGHFNGWSRVHREVLSGYEEVPAVSSTGKAKFIARINHDKTKIEYWLSYEDLNDTAGGTPGTITQSHIHFGDKDTNGGIMLWLCGTASNPGPAGTPACVGPGELLYGELTAENVVGPSGQGIAAGEWDEALKAIKAGLSYVNIHSTTVGSGELRSQISSDRDDHGNHGGK
jgi:hypothetical protein